MRLPVLALTATFLIVGCASAHLVPIAPASDADANLVFTYETHFNRPGESEAEVMRTEIRLSYDPEAGRVEGASVASSKDARALRTVKVAPDGRTIRLRIFTHVNGHRGTTSLLVDRSTPASKFYTQLGVGPENSLVEGVEIVFLDGGGWAVTDATGAHLITAGATVTRSMSSAQDGIENLVAKYP